MWIDEDEGSDGSIGLVIGSDEDENMEWIDIGVILVMIMKLRWY